MRLIALFLLLAVVVLGALFGAINSAVVAIDFRFAQVQAPLGIALLAALALGWLLGGLVAWLGHAMRRRASAAPNENGRKP